MMKHPLGSLGSELKRIENVYWLLAGYISLSSAVTRNEGHATRVVGFLSIRIVVRHTVKYWDAASVLTCSVINEFSLPVKYGLRKFTFKTTII